MTEQSGQRAPVDKVCGYEYTVKRGDSFYLIAHRLGVPLRDLLEANSEVNPARLMVGDVLCIPMEEDDQPQEEAAPAPEPEAAPAPEPEAVPSPLPEVAEPEPQAATEQASPAEEGLEDEDDSTPEELEMPAMPEASAAPAAPETAAEDRCVTGRAYVVRAGETAADIQMSAGLNLHTLELANPGCDFEALAAGDEICVPAENIPCDVPTTYTLRTDDTLESVALRHNLSVGALLRANPCLAPGDFVAGVTVLLGDA